MGHPRYEVKTPEGVTVKMRLNAEHAKKLGGKPVREKKAAAPANKQASAPDNKSQDEGNSQGEGAN